MSSEKCGPPFVIVSEVVVQAVVMPYLVLQAPDPKKPPLYYVQRYNNDQTYRDWFDSSFAGTAFEEIIGVPSSLDSGSKGKLACDQGDVLVFKAKNGAPTCVRPHTAEKVLYRGWGTDL